jgi:peptide/nickel transport system permease protein
LARLIAKKLSQAGVVMFLVVTATFFLIHLAPGDPFTPNIDISNISPARIAQMRRNFGLDEPIPVQYLAYLKNVATGDLGLSFSEHRPVSQVILDRLPNTLVLAGLALILDFLIGMSVGVWQAWKRDTMSDRVLTVVTLVLHSTPVFWLGLMLMLLFAVELRVLPVGGVVSIGVYESLSPVGQIWDRIKHLILPVTTLALIGSGSTARFQRAAMLETLSQDFIRTARAKGLSERSIVLKHALRNSLLPVITIFGLSFPVLLSGSVLVETVFGWPGMGMLTVDAVTSRDYMVVTAIGLISASMVITGNLIADLLYTVVDPRTRPGT